jgi:hypothetical protein
MRHRLDIDIGINRVSSNATSTETWPLCAAAGPLRSSFPIMTSSRAPSRSSFKVRTACSAAEMHFLLVFPKSLHCTDIIDFKTGICAILTLRFYPDDTFVQYSRRCYHYAQIHYLLTLTTETPVQSLNLDRETPLCNCLFLRLDRQMN